MPISRNDQRGPNQGNDRNPNGKSNRGFAAMDKEAQRQIARKGGEAVSRNREHMAEIGRRGGEASGQNRSRTGQVGQLQNQSSQDQSSIQSSNMGNTGTVSGENL